MIEVWYRHQAKRLCPLWRVKELSPTLSWVCVFNPFTHTVELVRFALYGEVDWMSFALVFGCTILFMVGAILAYDPRVDSSRILDVALD